MKKKIIIFTSLLFLTFCVLAAKGSTEKPILAVMEIEDESGEFYQNTLSSATEYLRGKLKSLNKYSIVISSRQEIATIKIMKENSYKSCYAEKCQIKLGQELSADTILATKLTYFGDIYTIRLEFIDIEKAVTTQSYEADFEKDDEKFLRDAIDDIVAQIAGVKKQGSRKEPKKKLEESSEICKQVRNRAKEYENDNNYDSAINIWSEYIKNYPDGLCYSEAKIEVKSLKDRKPDWKLKNSDFFGETDNDFRIVDPGALAWGTLSPGLLFMFVGVITLPIGLWQEFKVKAYCDDDEPYCYEYRYEEYSEKEKARKKADKAKKDHIKAGAAFLGMGVPLFITGLTALFWGYYTKGERAAGFLISFGTLAATVGGGTMMGLADGNKSLLGGGIATAVVGAGMVAGGIAIAVLDARARELKGSTSFFIVPNKDGVYAQLGVNF